MAWPASQQTLADAAEAVNIEMIKSRTMAQNISSDSLGGPVNRQRLVSLMQQLTKLRNSIDSATSLTGFVQYIKDQYDSQSFDTTAEGAAVRAAAVTLISWMDANLPRTGGAALIKGVDSDGNETSLTFSSASLSGFRAEAAAFIATIA